MPIRLLAEDDVKRLLTMDDAIEAVESALRKMALDEAFNIPRGRVQTDHAMLHLMGAAAKSLGFMGYKAYTTSRKGSHFHVGLCDGKTGALLALIHADWLGQMRTGAASGVATKFMARPDATTLGVFGSGKQARTQIMAICKVRTITRVHVYSPDEERRQRCAAEMAKECGVEVVAVESPEEAARGMDIIATATSSRDPVLLSPWIAAGTHLNAIGSNFLGKAELDAATVARANIVAVDSLEQARLEAGDFVKPLELGTLRWPDVQELGQIVVGRRPGRVKPEDFTLFKSLGIGLEDVAAAGKVYTRAVAENAGTMVEW